MIFLSAGHYLKDPGAVANGYQENKLTIQLRDEIGLYIPSKQLIKDNDNDTLAQVLAKFKPGSGSVCCEPHFNAASPTATGTEVIIANDAGQDSKDFAKDLAQSASDIMKIRNRGVITASESARGRLAYFTLPAKIIALPEVCFMSNPLELQKYLSIYKQLAKEWAGILIKYDALYQ